MVEEALTKDRILDTAEQVLRRFGPAKTSVVDVARALDVSHAAIYRYYESKSALRDAVAKRWLERLSEPLNKIVAEDNPPEARLRRWVEALIAFKRGKSQADPELFAMYVALAAEAREVVQRHMAELIDQLRQLLQEGVERGVFACADPQEAAQAILLATSRFHHPAHVAEWQDPNIQQSFNAIWDLLMKGLEPREPHDVQSPRIPEGSGQVTKRRKTK